MNEPVAGPERQNLAAECADYTRFVVLADGRTGSTMLVQALNSSPHIVCFGELFNWLHDDVDFDVAGYDNRGSEDKALRDRDFAAFLRERIFCRRPASVRAVGFKLGYGHVWGLPGLLEALMDDSQIRILHLRRRNLLRVLVSWKLAEATGVWHVSRPFTPAAALVPGNWLRALRHPTSAMAALRRRLRPAPAAQQEKPKLTLSAEECGRFFYRAQGEAEHFSQLFAEHPTLNLWYEDIVSDRAQMFEQALSFLNVEQTPLTVTLRKTNPEPLGALIANYDALREAFRGTPAEPFFE